MDKRALYFHEMLPSIEQLLIDLPENCESRTKLEAFTKMPPKALLIELDTDGDFGVSNIDDLKKLYTVACENSGDGLYTFCIPVPNDREETKQICADFLMDIKVRSSREYMQSRMIHLAGEALEQFTLFTFDDDDSAEAYSGNQKLTIKVI